MKAKAKFEDNIEELERIATELEKGKLNLDESVAMFEEGMRLSKECTKILEEAEKKISILINDENDIIEKSFEPEN